MLYYPIGLALTNELSLVVVFHKYNSFRVNNASSSVLVVILIPKIHSYLIMCTNIIQKYAILFCDKISIKL